MAQIMTKAEMKKLKAMAEYEYRRKNVIRHPKPMNTMIRVVRGNATLRRRGLHWTAQNMHGSTLPMAGAAPVKQMSQHAAGGSKQWLCQRRNIRTSTLMKKS